jgi:hypothetical protein
MKIAPGVRLNLTKKGVSARVGPKGLGITAGTSGTTVSAGIPGSGLHVSKRVKKGTTASSQKALAGADQNNKPATQRLGLFGWLGVCVIGFGILWIIY